MLTRNEGERGREAEAIAGVMRRREGELDQLRWPETGREGEGRRGCVAGEEEEKERKRKEGKIQSF
ncbi:hypothetical protein JCGZ_22208 [Jatropha curcas]|uniref:Uncharacterized protein n=1 Tax=Jatropha curcas TaxID=180498 RepID=A0A067JQD5_JATCU|nr:hypothetical protein JCGZ_22208 [Jatropha curcas]